MLSVDSLRRTHRLDQVCGRVLGRGSIFGTGSWIERIKINAHFTAAEGVRIGRSTVHDQENEAIISPNLSRRTLSRLSKATGTEYRLNFGTVLMSFDQFSEGCGPAIFTHDSADSLNVLT